MNQSYYEPIVTYHENMTQEELKSWHCNCEEMLQI